MRDYIYDLILERYANDQWFSDIRCYLDEYWLPDFLNEDSLARRMRSLVFGADVDDALWPEFNNDFAVALAPGGVVFSETECKQIYNLMEESGETKFFLVESYVNEVLREILINFRQRKERGDLRSGDGYWPPVRFVYQLGISYELITSGAALCTQPFVLGNGNWYLYGSSGSWGMYIQNDGKLPIRLIACERRFVLETKKLVQEFIGGESIESNYINFYNTNSFNKLMECIPEIYRERILRDIDVWK